MNDNTPLRTLVTVTIAQIAVFGVIGWIGWQVLKYLVIRGM